jgi:hypothetical protein
VLSQVFEMVVSEYFFAEAFRLSVCESLSPLRLVAPIPRPFAARRHTKGLRTFQEIRVTTHMERIPSLRAADSRRVTLAEVTKLKDQMQLDICVL